MKNKKLLSILGVAALLVAGNFAKQEVEVVDAATMKGGEVLYLTPSSNWKQSNARFAIYVFGTGDGWASMTDEDKDGVYEVTVPTGNWTNVIFCRMNPNAAANNWNNKWNQTSDLVYDGTKNHYTVKEGTWDKGGGTWSTYVKDVPTPDYEILDGIVDNYLNGGYYVRKTEIYADATAIAEDLVKNHPTKEYQNLFHAGATQLKRTTYFEGNQLWMTNEEGTINSGYGTAENGEMNHFKYENGVKNVDYTVAGSKGMEDWYKTLNDLTITEAQGWAKKGNGYTASATNNAELISWFKAFVAPCFVGFEDVPNYIIFDHVEIEEIGSELELRLYVSDGDSKKLTSDNNLFAKATIAAQKVTLPGDFNGDTSWSQTRLFNMTDSGYSYTMELAAGTYKFKVKINEDKWFGNDGEIPNTGCLDWEFTDAAGDCTLTVSEAGTYKFTFNVSTKKLSIQRL